MPTPPTNHLANKHLPPDHHPLGYFISFRTYGTWLHGDKRGSVDRDHNIHNRPFVQPHDGVEQAARSRMKNDPLNFGGDARKVVERTVVEVCAHRQWTIHAKNVRSNHVHIVVTAPDHRPERVADDLKAWCTRRLREAGVVPPSKKPWSRGRSNPYLWREQDLLAAINYVLEWQGPDLGDET